MPRPHPCRPLIGVVASGVAGAAQAAGIDGRELTAAWGVPFAGVLLSIALLPLAAPSWWQRHFGKVVAGWSLALVLPLAAMHGMDGVAGALAHTLLAEYVPFIVLLVALYTVSGGILVRGNLHGSPALNTGLIAIGALLASVMGTTGAAMLMIRPLIRANDQRRRAQHVYVFFIFVVGNIGGSLTPLGDPPLFLGFLQGVDFFWTLRHLWPMTLFAAGVLLAIFHALDAWYWRHDGAPRADPTPDSRRIGLDGKVNLLGLAAIVALVLASGVWKPGIAVTLAGVRIEAQDLLRDLALVGVTLASLAATPTGVRRANQFSWAPMAEVAILFAAIFVTMMPALAILRAGTEGAFAPIVRAVAGADGQPLPWVYFWLTGVLSSFLDNAPTYLVFFFLAGGDAPRLMAPMATTLAAISAGAVFMGANSYIGNAPNFMVKAVVEHRGIEMPSFLGYMAWSGAVLLPLFALVTLIWMR